MTDAKRLTFSDALGFGLNFSGLHLGARGFGLTFSGIHLGARFTYSVLM